MRQQAITWANVDPDLCLHTVLLCQNELIFSIIYPYSSVLLHYHGAVINYHFFLNSQLHVFPDMKTWCVPQKLELSLSDHTECRAQITSIIEILSSPRWTVFVMENICINMDMSLFSLDWKISMVTWRSSKANMKCLLADFCIEILIFPPDDHCMLTMGLAVIWEEWTLQQVVTSTFPDSKVHGANMGPTWGRQDPGRPHVGPMNLVIWVMLDYTWGVGTSQCYQGGCRYSGAKSAPGYQQPLWWPFCDYKLY